jgi:hypothetical protein
VSAVLVIAVMTESLVPEELRDVASVPEFMERLAQVCLVGGGGRVEEGGAGIAVLQMGVAFEPMLRACSS